MPDQWKTDEYRLHYVCFGCRRSFKQAPWVKQAPGVRPVFETMREVKCPQCGKTAAALGRKFHTPPRRDVQAWRKIELFGCRAQLGCSHHNYRLQDIYAFV